MRYMSFKNGKVSIEEKSRFNESYSNNLEGAIKRLTTLFSQDYFGQDPDLKNHRVLVWHLKPTSEGVDYLFYVLSCFGFDKVHEDSEHCTLKYSFKINLILFILIQRNKEKYIITSHFEEGSYRQKVRNLISTSVLSELQGLLKRKFPHIPIYMTYSSKSEEYLPKKGITLENSKDLDNLNHDLTNHFCKSLESAVNVAKKDSIKKKEIINRESMIQLIYDQILKDLNRDLIHISFTEKLDFFVRRNIDNALDIVKQTYLQSNKASKQPREIPPIFLAGKRLERKDNQDVALDYSYYNDKPQKVTSPPGISKYRKKVVEENLKKAPFKGNRVDKAYTESIRTYVYHFCGTALTNTLKQQYLSASTTRDRLIRAFKQLLKTISSNFKVVYEDVMNDFVRERFSLEYKRISERLHGILEANKTSIFTQWSNDHHFTSLLFCASNIIFIIVMFYIGMFSGESPQDPISTFTKDPLFYFITAFIIVLSLRSACWIIVNIVKYRQNVKKL